MRAGFLNPTGGAIRVDEKGDGHFLAPRDGGRRRHRGLDLLVKPGKEVISPIAGIFTRKALPYSDDPRWSGVLIEGLRMHVKMFYLEPYEELIGSVVAPGAAVGRAQDIGIKYGCIPHIHLSVILPPRSAIGAGGELIGEEVYIDPELLLG